MITSDKTVVLSTIILLLLKATPSMTQSDVLLFQNGSDASLCSGSIVQYTCIASSTLLQWILESDSISYRTTSYQPSSPLEASRIDDNIVVETIRVMPFIASTFTITLNSSYDVTCSIADQSEMRINISIISTIVSSPGPPVMITENADYDDGIFHINFSPSTTPNVRYECNCTSDTCQKVIVENNLASLRASASFSGVCHNVCVCAINTCGDGSPPICRKLCLKTTHGYRIATILSFTFGFFLFLAVIALIALGIVICVRECAWRRAEEAHRQQLIEMSQNTGQAR